MGEFSLRDAVLHDRDEIVDDEGGVLFDDRIVDFPVPTSFLAAESTIKIVPTATTSGGGTWSCYPGILIQRIA